jgi:Leucine-rich repeat (LRR) protein
VNESLFSKNLYLRTIDLRNNQIKELPSSICDLKLLWKLRIDNNLIEELP